MSDSKKSPERDSPTRFRRPSKTRVSGQGTSALQRLHETMNDPALLDYALTHASHSGSASGRENYERLEFLGDAVLGLIVVEHIYARFPDAAEGPLARLKASLVSAETLSDVATEHSLFEAVKLGDMPKSQMEMARKNVGADVVESIIGAVYLDQGYETARSLVFELFGPRLAGATLKVTGARDAKTTLHELVQGELHERPHYHVLEEEGPPHARRFLIEVRIRGHQCGQEWGTSHKNAEQGAAALALEAIEKGEIVLENLPPHQQN